MRLSALFAVPVLVLSAGVLAQAQTAASSSFQITKKTEAPGSSLTPGSYTVRIADHLNDRMIIEVEKTGGHDKATLLAYPNTSLGSAASGPILFNSGLKNKPTLRGFAFPGGPTVEFVYPKQDAVTLAKANDVKVMAVDPASEGRPKLPQLTSTDMNEVTLWMLTPTPVQPGAEPGIQAARYQAPTSASGNAELASQPAPQPAYHPISPAASQPVPAEPVQVASNARPHIRPAVKQLPHTASNIPAIALLGLLSFGVAGGLGTTRRVMHAGEKSNA